MANTAKKISQVPACNSPVSNNKLVITGNNDSNSFYLTIQTLFGNNSSNVKITTITPSSSSANGAAGTIAYDSSYIYVCVAANTWRRASLSSW